MSRKVLITGGRVGIGLATARRFVASGDQVFISGRVRRPVAEAADEIGATAVGLDPTDPDSVAALPDKIGDGLDVLVNNAGGVPSIRRLPADADAKIRRDVWHEALDFNLMSAVLVTTSLAPVLRSGGAVISIGSRAAEMATSPYAASKAALAAWNVGMSVQLAEQRVTANVIAPGYIAGTEFFADSMSAARHAELVEGSILKVAGCPGDIAGAAFFLASPDARYITGQTIHVDGGAFTTR